MSPSLQMRSAGLRAVQELAQCQAEARLEPRSLWLQRPPGHSTKSLYETPSPWASVSSLWNGGIRVHGPKNPPARHQKEFQEEAGCSLVAHVHGKISVFTPICCKTARPQVYTERSPGRCHGNHSGSREPNSSDLARLANWVTWDLPYWKTSRQSRGQPKWFESEGPGKGSAACTLPPRCWQGRDSMGL